MKVAVTGATGFIGRHLVAALRARGHAVTALLRDVTAKTGADDVRGLDLARAASAPEEVDQAVLGIDAIVHAAAYLPKSYADAGEARACLEVNALGTLALLEGCVRNAVKRAIVFSSNVYGQGADPVTEDAPAYPAVHAPYYMMSKLCGEVWAEHFGRSGRLATASLRVASVYGPGLTRGMIPTFTSTLLQGKPVTIKDGGRYRSDLVYVGDVVDAATAALERDALGIFNVGSGTTSSSLEIAETLAKLTGAPRTLLQVEPANETAAPLGFAPLDVGRARRELGYSPRSVEHALRDYVAWYRDHPPG